MIGCVIDTFRITLESNQKFARKRCLYLTFSSKVTDSFSSNICSVNNISSGYTILQPNILTIYTF